MKKGFTLTELLVVVIVIGVLSAVVLPKFSKVIETRKTTEAEELLAGIRTEQEKRCALDRKYLTKMSELTDIVKTANTKNYNITLQNTGVQASSTGNYSYTLQMPSYADGRICCSGDDCEKLNKNYPKCDDLIKKEDYQPVPDSCVDEEPKQDTCKDCSCAEYASLHPAQCNPEPAKVCDASHTEGQIYTRGCSCGEAKGVWHCGEDTGYTWTQRETVGCYGKPNDEKQECESGSGTQTRSYECKNGKWEVGEWSECVLNPTCETPTSDCTNGEKWTSCSHFEYNADGSPRGSWCYRSMWNTKTCSWDKPVISGPPTFCSAAKSPMSPYFCTCTDPEDLKPETKYVWKQAWQQELLADTNGSYNNHPTLKDINYTLLRCKGVTLHDWNEISQQCSQSMTVGGECASLGESCVKLTSSNLSFGTGSLSAFCEYGANPRTGNSANLPCDYHAPDSMEYYINQLCGSDVSSTASWSDYRFQLNARFVKVTSYVCAPQQ